jgi:hypothetical protein
LKGDLEIHELLQPDGLESLSIGRRSLLRLWHAREENTARVRSVIESDMPEDALARFGLFLVERDCTNRSDSLPNREKSASQTNRRSRSFWRADGSAAAAQL